MPAPATAWPPPSPASSSLAATAPIASRTPTWSPTTTASTGLRRVRRARARSSPKASSCTRRVTCWASATATCPAPPCSPRSAPATTVPPASRRTTATPSTISIRPLRGGPCETEAFGPPFPFRGILFQDVREHSPSPAAHPPGRSDRPGARQGRSPGGHRARRHPRRGREAARHVLHAGLEAPADDERLLPRAARHHRPGGLRAWRRHSHRDRPRGARPLPAHGGGRPEGDGARLGGDAEAPGRLRAPKLVILDGI